MTAPASGSVPLAMLSDLDKAAAIIDAARKYDYEHRRDNGERGSWGSVPHDQVLRLIVGERGAMDFGEQPAPAPTARCLKPYEHSDNLTGAVVDCNHPEHHEPAPAAAPGIGVLIRKLDRYRELLDEIGVLAANAPEDDAFSVCEDIAWRIAAHGIPQEGK